MRYRFAPLALLLMMGASSMAASDRRGHITGIGGVFVTSNDPIALANWYRDVLGVSLEAWGGAVFRHEGESPVPASTWTSFRHDDAQFAPSGRDFLINFTVDDLDTVLARLTAKHVPILKHVEDDPYGKFAWILDPDGTKIELWQPSAAT